MRKLSLIALTTSVVVSSFAFLAGSASAIPVFARKYNVQCNMCHTVPPRLNKFGIAYKQNGFELPPGTILPESEVWGNQVLASEEPKAVVGAGLPLMLRTGLAAGFGNTATIPLGYASGEFGLIGGGSVETEFGSLGFWIDAPNATFGALELDMNFNPMFKLTIANAIAPQVGYGLGLPVNAFGVAIAANVVGATRNEAATMTNGAFTWGNNSNPGIEVRGTTDPATGLGFNYSVGFLTGGASLPAAAVYPQQDPYTVYGAASYYIGSIATNFTVGYSYERLTVAPNGLASKADPTQLLVSIALNPGDNLQATLTYNSQTGGNGIAANTTTNYITFAPEYLITPKIYVGGRYSTWQNTAPAAVSNSLVSLGAGYKLLQNLQLYLNYTSTNIAGVAASNIISGVDFVY